MGGTSSQNILFPCLDRRRYLPVDISDSGSVRKIPVSPETVFIATANVGNEYGGTQAIDRALMDRFFIIELDYPTQENEIAVIINRTGIDKKHASAIVKVHNKIREQYKKEELGCTVSVRHSLECAELVRDGFTIESALNSIIMPLFQDGIGANERTKIKTILAAY